MQRNDIQERTFFLISLPHRTFFFWIFVRIAFRCIECQYKVDRLYFNIIIVAVVEQILA